MFASKDEPLTKEKQNRQLGHMKRGLANLQHSPDPIFEDWEVISDAVNMMETLLHMGMVEDPDDAIGEAVAALGKTGDRCLRGQPLRLDGPAIGLLKGVLEDYEMVLENIPARTMIMAHRATEKRVQAQIVESFKRERAKEAV